MNKGWLGEYKKTFSEDLRKIQGGASKYLFGHTTGSLIRLRVCLLHSSNQILGPLGSLKVYLKEV